MRPSIGRMISNTGAYDKAGETAGGIANTMYGRGVGVGSTGGLSYGRPLNDQRLTTMPGDTGDYRPIAQSMAASGTPVSNPGDLFTNPAGVAHANAPAAQSWLQNKFDEARNNLSLPPVPAGTPTYMNSRPGPGMTPAAVNSAFSAGRPYTPPVGGAAYDPWAASGTQSPAQAATTPQNAMLAGLGYGGARPATQDELAAAGWGSVYNRMANPR